MSRIVLATDDAACEQRIRAAFPQVLNGDLRRIDPELLTQHTALDALAGPPGGGTEVLALGPGCSLDGALEVARRFDVERPEVSVLLVTAPTADVLARSLRAGVRDIVSPKASGEEVVAAFDRAAEVARARQHTLGRGGDDPPAGRIITVISPKGGSGKTTTATNLALGLAQAAPGEVVLVDLDLQFGDAASALQLDPESTIADVGHGIELDSAAVKVALTSHPSGLYVLCAPESPAEADAITAELAGLTLRTLAAQFRYVVVDTDAGLSEHALVAIEASTDLICLCSMDVPSVRGLRKELLVLDQLGMTSARRHFLVNRADARVGLESADIEATVQLPIDVAVPSSRAVPLSMNQGIPVIQADPRSPVARQFSLLVSRFAEQPAARTTGGLLRRRKENR